MAGLQGVAPSKVREPGEALAKVKNHQDQDIASARRASRGAGSRAARRQLERILDSPDFDASRRSREFLRFIVEETLAGRGEPLTQSAIATAVFGRREDFDPIVDPIVRIQAGRLRRSLERYYLLSGRGDLLRIELPKGSYVPTFRGADPVAVEPEPGAPAVPEAGEGDGWPVILLGDFEAVGDAPELRSTANRMSDELALEIGRYGAVRIVRRRGGQTLDAALRDRARFAFDARIERAGERLRVTAHLTDRVTGQELWGDEYMTPFPGDGATGREEDVARVIAARIAAEEGVVVHLLAAERRKRRTGPSTAYDGFLVACEFFYSRDPQALVVALQALRDVVRADPDCGWAWTWLARLYVANVAFEVTTLPTPIEEAVACAQQGVRADPSSRSARCILAVALLLKGELAGGRSELQHALSSWPDSLVYLEIIGYELMLLGEWERGYEVCRAALERNPHCLPHVQFGLWAYHLRKGEIEQAHQAALAYRDPTFFIRSAMRATCLGLLGRTEEGRLEAARLLASKPDFAVRGRTLLGHYLKFPVVLDRVLDGLERVGLTLA
jgi:tetratricopeptide (TPR) repeat protein